MATLSFELVSPRARPVRGPTSTRSCSPPHAAEAAIVQLREAKAALNF
jgi:hypothetical protein